MTDASCVEKLYYVKNCIPCGRIRIFRTFFVIYDLHCPGITQSTLPYSSNTSNFGLSGCLQMNCFGYSSIEGADPHAEQSDMRDKLSRLNLSFVLIWFSRFSD